MSLYKRPARTYVVPDGVVEGMLRDDANPLLRIATLIPDGSTVLDVGAGSGLLPLLARGLGKRIVFDGVEPDPAAAAIGSVHYRDFHAGMLKDCPFRNRGASYDFIVAADVVEHTPDPEDFIRALSSFAGERSKFLLSIPNVSFAAVRIALLNGSFQYVDSGILERTHLRFFTLESIEQLIARASLHVHKLFLLQRDPHGTEIDIERYPIWPLWRLARDELALTYQFLFELAATPAERQVLRYAAPRSGGIWTIFRRYRRMLVARRP